MTRPKSENRLSTIDITSAIFKRTKITRDQEDNNPKYFSKYELLALLSWITQAELKIKDLEEEAIKKDQYINDVVAKMDKCVSHIETLNP